MRAFRSFLLSLGCVVVLVFGLAVVAVADDEGALAPVVALESLDDTLDSDAWSINDAGVIVGSSADQACRWVPTEHGWRVESLVGDMVDYHTGDPIEGEILWSIATGVNELGQIAALLVVETVIEVEDETLTVVLPWAALWEEEGVLRVLPGLGFPRGINVSGHIVGHDPDAWLGMVWRDGMPAPLPPLPGGTESVAFAVNDPDEYGIVRIVGQSDTANGAWVPTLWEMIGDDGEIVTVELASRGVPDPPPIGDAFGRAISNDGLIGGIDWLYPSVWDAAAPGVEIPVGPGRGQGSPGAVNGVNEWGEMVGYLGGPALAYNHREAVWWASTDSRPVRLFPPAEVSFARDINNHHQVVGNFSERGTPNRAFVISLR